MKTATNRQIIDRLELFIADGVIGSEPIDETAQKIFKEFIDPLRLAVENSRFTEEDMRAAYSAGGEDEYTGRSFALWLKERSK